MSNRGVFGSQLVEGGGSLDPWFGCPPLEATKAVGLAASSPWESCCLGRSLPKKISGEKGVKESEEKKRKKKGTRRSPCLPELGSGVCAWGMNELLAHGRGLGLSPDDITRCVRLGRPLSDSNWCRAADAGASSLEIAIEMFEQGKYIEYQCYDNQHQEQGRAIVQLLDWEDRAAGLFLGDHGIASDGYYEYYVKNDLQQGVVFHLCQCRAAQCKTKLRRGDRRELIHIDQWRLLSPQVMVETGYLKDLGKVLGKAALDEAVKGQRPPAGGTGLDAAVHNPPGPPLPPEPPVDLGQERSRRSRSRKRRQRLGEFLEDQRAKAPWRKFAWQAKRTEREEETKEVEEGQRQEEESFDFRQLRRFQWVKLVCFAFSENLGSGRGSMAFSRKEARAPVRDGAEGNGPLPGRKLRADPGPRRVGVSQGVGLSEPDSADKQPSRKNRPESPSGAGHPGHLLGPAAKRAEPSGHGRDDAAVQSRRSISVRRKLESGPSLRAHTSSRSSGVKREREGASPESRIEAHEVARDLKSPGAHEIGSRQRVSRAVKKEIRESVTKPRKDRSPVSGSERRSRERTRRKPKQEDLAQAHGGGEETKGRVQRPKKEDRRRGRSTETERAEGPAIQQERVVFLKGESSGRRHTDDRSDLQPAQEARDSRRRAAQEHSESPRRERKRRRQERGEAFLEEAEAQEITLVERKGQRETMKDPRDDSQILRDWLAQEPPSNLSAAQLAFHLLLQAVRNRGPLQKYVEWSLQSPEKREVRERNLFPLPLWPDCRAQLQKVLAEGSAKDRPGQWRERAESRGAAQKVLRLDGLKAWHGLVVISLNYLQGDRAQSRGPYPGGDATEAQEKALGRIWNALKIFVDDKEKKGVPRTPLEEWKNTISDLSVTYTGEIVEKAARLTLRQILPGLPSKDHGGLVDLLELLPEDLKESLQQPENLVKKEFVGPMPKPRIMCDDEEWLGVVSAMFERGLVQPAAFVPAVEGQPVLNGAFGVPKAGKTLESGEEVLRLIMDLRSTNWMMTQLEADTATLTGAASFQRLVVESDEELLVSGEDLTAAFYLFRLPSKWSSYMVLGRPVPGHVLGLKTDALTHAGLCVLPMGWHSSVGLMQAAHRRLALGSPLRGGAGLPGLAEINRQAVFPDMDEGPAWSIYLDDTTILEKVSEAAAKELEGKVPAEQAQLRKAYEWWGIPTNPSKALERQRKAERLGAVIDGRLGVLRTSTLRSLQVCSLGAWIRGQSHVARKALQVYAGKLVHILQFRRCMFSYLDEVFGCIAHGPPEVPVTEKLRSEMILLEMAIPMAMFNLKAAIDPIVTASDACESGGGICVASRLSRAGKEEVEMMLDGKAMEREKPEDPTALSKEEKVLVIDLFSGIGGLTMALQKAGCHWEYLVCIEKDKDCRRLLRRVHPGVELIGDVKKFGLQELRRILKKVPGVTGIIVGGGSPCQGLSRLSSGREHLLDERSKLFFEAARIFAMVEEEARSLKIWALKLLENVVADAQDVAEMSFELGIEPVLVDAQYLSRARRPRLFWLSVALQEEEDVEFIQLENFKQVIYRAKPEPVELFLEAGHDWAGGMRDEGLKFPTFTRAIKRKKPPPQPAGLKGLGDAARLRWEEHQFRYPPYTYHDDYMILTPEVTLRPLKAGEREILMGFPQGHVEKLLKKPPETKEEREEAEDLQASAIGNSFHTNSVACLLDHALASMGLKERKKAPRILEESMAMQSKKPAETKVEELEEEEEESFVEEEMDSISLAGNEFMDRVEKKSRSRGLKKEFESDEKLSQLLVAAYIRRQEFRGCDVRLDVGSLYRPDSFPRAGVSPTRWVWHVAHHWPFKQQERINVLELRSLIHTFEWRLRKSSFGDTRALHLTDSQVALSVAVKGRSSSKQLNRQLRRFTALQLAGGLYPLLAWVESALNPADAPSRFYEEK